MLSFEKRKLNLSKMFPTMFPDQGPEWTHINRRKKMKRVLCASANGPQRESADRKFELTETFLRPPVPGPLSSVQKSCHISVCGTVHTFQFVLTLSTVATLSSVSNARSRWVVMKNSAGAYSKDGGT